MAPWTHLDIPDLSGRTALVTGASSGLGEEVAWRLAEHGAHVTLAVRDAERGRNAAARIRARTGANPDVQVVDLADLDAVRRLPEALGDLRLDVLVNNAGVMAVPYRTSRQGHELQLATNHLGHAALTLLLLPRLTPGARVVTVSSDLHRLGRPDDLRDLTGPADGRGYGPWRAYGRSKLANLLFALELDRRLRRVGSTVASVAAHPGHADSGLRDHITGPRRVVVAALDRLVGRPTEAGALPILRAATDPSVAGGEYLGPTSARRSAATAVRSTPSRAAQDAELAADLWRRTEQLVEVTWPDAVGRR